MGYYTELIFKAELIGLKESDIKAIEWINGKHHKNQYESVNPDWLPKHPFFKEMRADMITQCDRIKVPLFYKTDPDTYILDSHAEIKNYESEIELFLNWIVPFIKKGLLENDICAKTKGENFEDYILIHKMDIE